MKNGQSLAKYLREHNLPYTQIWLRVSVDGMKPEEAIEDWKKNTRHTKHFIGGRTLRSLCKEIGVSYEVVLSDWKRNGYRRSLKEEFELYRTGEKKPRQHLRYFYNGVKLRDFCNANEIPYETILNTYLRENKYNKVKTFRTMDQIVEEHLAKKTVPSTGRRGEIILSADW
jgi:hypothetical protein